MSNRSPRPAPLDSGRPRSSKSAVNAIGARNQNTPGQPQRATSAPPIIGIGRPKLPVMSGKAMLTAVSSGTTEMPSPTSTRRKPSRNLAEPGAATPFTDVAPGSICRLKSARRLVGAIMVASSRNASPGFALAVHGGAGTLRRAAMSAARAALYHAGLRPALVAGRDILVADGSALDTV